MRIYEALVPKPVFKSLKRVSLPWRERLIKTINFLKIDPFYGKSMSGSYKGKRRVKIWPYRIVYRIDSARRLIIIVEIAHRGSVSYD